MPKETEISTIPTLRQVYRLTKAQLNALVGLRDGALGFATDEIQLYRQNGNGVANWELIAADAVALITTHSALATVHQDAPALIAAAGHEATGVAASLITTHSALATVHQDAPALIAAAGHEATGVAASLIATHAGLPNIHHTPSDSAMAIIHNWQRLPATGTVTSPERINDDNPGQFLSADAVGEYAEVDFGLTVAIKRWRQYGKAEASTGVFKIEYYDGSWQDWVTGISIRPTANWSAYITETERLASKIRVTHTTISGGGANYIGELEVIY